MKKNVSSKLAIEFKYYENTEFVYSKSGSKKHITVLYARVFKSKCLFKIYMKNIMLQMLKH